MVDHCWPVRASFGRRYDKVQGGRGGPGQRQPTGNVAREAASPLFPLLHVCVLMHCKGRRGESRRFLLPKGRPAAQVHPGKFHAHARRQHGVGHARPSAIARYVGQPVIAVAAS